MSAEKPENQSPAGAGLSGREFGPYQLISELGHGGQGFVWRAFDPRLGRHVALKLLASRAAMSEAARLRFLREAEISSKLDHPGICPVYEAGEIDGVLFIAMPFLEGRTLDRLIGRGSATLRDVITEGHTGTSVSEHGSTYFSFGSDADADILRQTRETAQEPDDGPADTSEVSATSSLGSHEIQQIVMRIEDVARALHFAHEAGLVHRDIKPGNIMVTRNDRMVLLDFGLAYEVGADGPALTETGDLFGTPAYMSPEQLAATTKRVDRRSDIYSLGVTLYEWISGRRPFEAPTRQALFQNILSKEPADIQSYNSAVKSDLKVVIEAALEKDPECRYQTALDFADDLRRFVNIEPILAKPPSVWTRGKRFVQRNPQLALLILATFLFFSIGTTLLLFKNRELEESRLEIQSELARNESIREYLTNMLRLAPREEGEFALTLRELLSAAALDLENSFADQPEVRLTLYDTIAGSFEALGLDEKANKTRWQALEQHQKVVPEGDYWTILLRFQIAKLQAQSPNRKKVDEALELNLETYEMAKRILGRDDPLTGKVVTFNANFNSFRLSLDSSKEIPEFIVSFVHKLHPDKLPKEKVREQMTELMHEADRLVAEGQVDLAARKIRESLTPFMNAGPLIKSNLPRSVAEYANKLIKAEQYNVAEALLNTNLILAREIFTTRPLQVDNHDRRLARFYTDRRKWSKAEPLWRRLLARHTEPPRDKRESARQRKDRHQLADMLIGRSEELIRVGRLSGVRKILEESLRLLPGDANQEETRSKQLAEAMLATLSF